MGIWIWVYNPRMEFSPEIIALLLAGVPPAAAVATDKTPYMYHCHILEHEDRGMMGQFTVR